MATLNQVILLGRLTRDPETRKAGDYQVTNFGIAVDREYSKDKKADFFDCGAWGKTGEFVGNFLKKGNQVLIQGRLRFDSSEKDGKKFSKVSVVADKVENLTPKETIKDENLDEAIDLSSIPF